MVHFPGAATAFGAKCVTQTKSRYKAVHHCSKGIIVRRAVSKPLTNMGLLVLAQRRAVETGNNLIQDYLFMRTRSPMGHVPLMH